MRVRMWLVVAGCLFSVSVPGQGGAPQAPVARAGLEAAAILAGAREALGGEKRLGAIKTFVATGQTRQVRGDSLIPIEFEISVELPDKYARRDETPAVESGYSTSGFAGDDLIQLPLPAAPVMPPMAARPGGPPPPTPEQLAAQQTAQRKARVNMLKQDFARLTLGMFATSFPGYPMTFAKVAIAESPQGKADVIEVKGPGAGPTQFVVRLLINQESRLPVMLSWTPPARPMSPAPPEQRLYFADYRNVDGLMLPFRLRRAVGPDTTEETTFDRYRLNVRIDARKFEVVR